MPKYDSRKWNDYEISVKPTGIRRYFNSIPYLSGDDVRLNISVKTISGSKREFIYKWRLFRFDGTKEWPVTDYFEHNFVGNPKDRFDEMYSDKLATYGQYNLQLQLDNIKEERINTGSMVMAVFSILERDKIVPYTFFSLISLIIGAGLTLLVQWIINKST